MPLTVEQFIDVLQRSGLAERRPVGDRNTMQGMVENTNLLITAWSDATLVGMARSMTDFHYACYTSELAVATDYQHQGIGTELLRQTRATLGPRCKLLLVSAPAANDYYPKLGFVQNNRTWVLPHDAELKE